MSQMQGTTVNRNIQSKELLSTETCKWCAICSTVVGSTALLLIGFSLLIRGLGTTGLVLVFVGGTILVLTICAVVGKCKMDPVKEPPVGHEDPPPSYRISWRRSFLRHHRAMNSSNTDTELMEVPHITSETQSNNTAGVDNATYEHTIIEGVPLHMMDPSSPTTLCHVLTRQGKQAQHASGGCLTDVGDALSPKLGSTNTRYAVSLSNIVDPPNYEAAFASMDEGSLRKLKSEICIPSLSHH